MCDNDENKFRQIFFYEVKKDHWVSVSLKGEFDSDIWSGLKALVDSKAIQPKSRHRNNEVD